MNRLNIAIWMLAWVCLACSEKLAASATAESSKDAQVQAHSDEPEMGVPSAVHNSWLTARVTDVKPPQGSDDPCKSHPCIATIEILAIDQFGSNYHGQIEAGQTIDVHFDFTLDPSTSIFPELNQPLPGLNRGDFFQAELYESVDEPSMFRVKLYNKIEQ